MTINGVCCAGSTYCDAREVCTSNGRCSEGGAVGITYTSTPLMPISRAQGVTTSLVTTAAEIAQTSSRFLAQSASKRDTFQRGLHVVFKSTHGATTNTTSLSIAPKASQLLNRRRPSQHIKSANVSSDQASCGSRSVLEGLGRDS